MAGAVVKATLTADARQFQAGFKKAEDSTKGFESKISKTASLTQGFLAGAAATAVIGFATDTVKAFSDVEQSAGSVESVFGESAGKIIDQAEGAAEAFGLSAADFQKSAALIGSMLKNQMGLSAEEAAEQVDDLTGKAADMAATFGGTTADAIDAIGSLLRGERDPIERYGVSMNDAAIKARALELGLQDATGEIDAAAKATAALDILNEQTADSTGQFARESDTLAGSQQILAAEFQNAKAKLGEQLAPAVTDAIELFTKLVTKIAEVEEGWQSFGRTLDEGREKLGFTGQTALEQVDAWENHNTIIGEAVRGMEDARTHGLEPLTDALDDQADAEGDLAGKIRDTITIRQESFDQVKGQMDTFWGLVDATEDQAAAQTEVNRLEELGLQNTPTYTAAVRDLAEAGLDVEAAQLALLDSGGLTREEFERQRVKMGLTADQAQVLIDKYGIIFTPQTVEHTVRYHEIVESDSTGRTYPGGRQQGGYVQSGTPYLVGEKGPEVMVPNTGGRVIPNAGIGPAMQGGGGTVNNITVHAGMGSDPNAISKAIVEALQRYQRANGAVPIRTRP